MEPLTDALYQDSEYMILRYRDGDDTVCIADVSAIKTSLGMCVV